MLWLMIIIFSMFMLQYLLTFLQMKSFRKYFSKFIKQGKVAIGIKKGIFFEGCIVMFLIDDYGNIKNASMISGFTVFSRFKEFNKLNNYNLLEFDEEILKLLKFSRSKTKAILNAKENFIKVKNGEEIELKKSPFQQITSKIFNIGG
ncbi:MAG: transcriptional regulator GutM [Tissierellia bacterium]|nr:transcriptional regulator GutM [Tissierellia bacterium]